VLTRTRDGPRRCLKPKACPRSRRLRATLAIHLSIHALEKTVAELIPPMARRAGLPWCFVASWPDERIIRADARHHRRREFQKPTSIVPAYSRWRGAGRAGYPRQRAVRQRLSARFRGEARDGRRQFASTTFLTSRIFHRARFWLARCRPGRPRTSDTPCAPRAEDG